MATLTFLFTDIEGSTRLWEAHPEAMRAALDLHDLALGEAIAEHHGKVFKHTGDGMLAVFSSAPDAVAAASHAQQAIVATDHPKVGVLRVRMAVHTGEAEPRGDDFFGPGLNRVARLLAVAHGGQILVGMVTEGLVGSWLPDGLCLVDLGEHQLRDLAQSERVFQLSGDGLPSEFPPLATFRGIPSNLPVPATSFVGRDRELTDLEELVRGARLVTVTGVGGAGKTRVALQVASSMATEFPGGTWLVELAPVTDPDLVIAAAARALGVIEQPGQQLFESLVERLAGSKTLLIIDNCEHVIGAGADLAEAVLTGTEGVKIIATSRELLNIGAEVVFGMRSMSVPGVGENLTRNELEGFDAVRLFVDRASASRTDFRLTDDNATSVAEICRRLDGMPLALELAAARVRSFSPAEIADRLDQRFRLLTGGSRTALPRQQTLAAAIDWSYQLLDTAERALFERLSVFQGGFTLAAAERVCVEDSVDTFDALDLVPSLIDKSLVMVGESDSETRYALLETIRQFARDLLHTHERADGFRLRHADYFVEFAESAQAQLRGPDEGLTLERIGADLDNLRHAMSWSIESGNPELGIRIACAMSRYWWLTGQYTEGFRWLDVTLKASSSLRPGYAAARGHLALSSLAGWLDLDDVRKKHLATSLEIFRQLDAEGASAEVVAAGLISARINLESDPTRILELYGEALEIARRYEDQSGIASALGMIADTQARLGNLDKARAVFEESIAATAQLESPSDSMWAIGQLAQVELGEGSPSRAEAAFRRALSHAIEAGLVEWAAFVRTQIAMARHDSGTPGMRAEFATQVGVALEKEDWRKSLLILSGWLVERADLDLAAGEADTAALLIGASFALDETWRPLQWKLESRRRRVLGQLETMLGEAEVEAAMAKGAGLSVDDQWALVTAAG